MTHLHGCVFIYPFYTGRLENQPSIFMPMRAGKAR
nr:MAG TPA: hypothetical protein [Caudoviricetes sp.]